MAGSDVTKPAAGKPARSGDIFTAMRDEMDRMMERFERGWPSWPALKAASGTATMVPHLDVSDDGKQLKVEVDLPGVDEKDISITVADGVLTVKGEKKSEREEKKDNYFLSERSYGSFERALRLPEGVDEDKLDARFEKGVLTIVAPKQPQAVKSEKRVAIKSG